MRTFFSYLALIFVLTGCQPDPIPIEIPQADSKLVVYTQNLPNQALIVSLSKSFSALAIPNDDDFEDSSDSLNTRKNDSINALFVNQFLVESAIVTLIGPDFNDTLIQLSTGFYIAPFFPFTPGNSYRLEAFDPNTGMSISSNTETLPIVSLESLTAKRGKGKDSSIITINYKVADIDGENYYLLNVYTDSIPQSDFFGFNSDSNGQSFIFSDREYAKNQIIREDKFYYERSTDTIIATLTNISRDYYNFLTARKRAGNSFLSEPVSYPTNIVGGYGYFNLHFPSLHIAEIKL